MTDIKESIMGLTDQEFNELKGWIVTTETDRRAAAEVVEEAQAKVVIDLQNAGKLPSPDALTDPSSLPNDDSDVPQWVNPGTDHSAMYREGDIVSHNGKIVRSTHKGLNHWEPGTLNFDGRIWEIIEKPTTGTTDEAGTPTGNKPEGNTEERPPQDAPKGSKGNPYEFRGGLTVKAGEYVESNGNLYRVIQGHTTQDGWQPDAVPALFARESR